MWQTIVRSFEPHALHTKLAVRRKFPIVFMASMECVLIFINCVQHLGSMLKGMGVIIDRKELVMDVLIGLLKHFESLIVALVALANDDKFLLKMIRGEAVADSFER